MNTLLISVTTTHSSAYDSVDFMYPVTIILKEISKIVQKEELAHSAAPRRRASTSPCGYVVRRQRIGGVSGPVSTFSTDGDQPGLEIETQLLATLERRQTMELKQTLSYKLQHFWREVKGETGSSSR